jgi:beta-1,2-rhamnosyltransferase WsaF-like protein
MHRQIIIKSKTVGYLRKLARPLKRLRGSRPDSFFVALPREFDPGWYRQSYLQAELSQSPLDHYLGEGIKAGNSPNKWFDEAFYVAFYSDVRDGVAAGEFLNGFHHYLMHGRAERRLAHFDLQKALEARMPGVTQAAEMWLVDGLYRRLKPISAIKSSRRAKVLWFLLPTLNPDIMFGGYRSVLELIKHLRERNRDVRILICEDERGNLEYFKYHYRDSDLGAAFADVTVLNRWKLRSPLEIGPNDRIYAYSAWEAHLAHGLASLTNEPRFVFLVQEYEAIFHNFGSEHAIVSAAYRLPHFPIFNSDALRRFFEQSRIGLFSTDASKSVDRQYAVIEHVVTKLKSPDRKKMLKKKGARRLVMYARPERHAARNLFSLSVLGLRRAIERDIVKGHWEMVGVGALSEGHTVYLPEGYELYLKTRMSSDQFAALLTDTDLGISLMYAPHPGLVTYELAKAGARVVTNTFGNRDGNYLRQISENIVPCDATIDGVATGIQEAISGLKDIESRLRGANIRGPKSWSDVFDDGFFAKLSEFC